MKTGAVRTLLCLLVFGVGCSSKEDVTLTVEERLLASDYLRALDKIGPHRLHADLSVTSSGPAGTAHESLTEDADVDIHGNYRVKRREDKGKSPWEILSIGSNYYLTQPNGKVQMIEPGLLGQTTLKRAGEAWKTVLEPFAGAFVLSEQTPGKIGERPALQFKISLIEGAKAPESAVFAPEALSGTIVLDKETSFPVSVKLKARYVRTDEGKPSVSVDIDSFSFKVSDLGGVQALRPPIVPVTK